MKKDASKIEIKIAYIGGGSRYWARELVGDLALCPHICGELALYDLDYEAALKNIEVANEIFNRPASRTKFKVTVAKKAQDALKGADFVICSIEPGPTQMRYADLEIPAKYGIVQTVGDSTGPGGIVRALRSIPIKMHYARLVMKYCPKAWVINYTNPMTLCTAAFYAADPKIKAFGCCHEVFGTQRFLVEKVNEWFGAEDVKRQDIILDIAGVNHFTFATSATWKDKDLFKNLSKLVSESSTFRDRTAKSRENVRKGLWFASDKLVSLDYFRRFGALGAAGDRHLVEFVPWYLSSEKELHRWGVLCTPFSWRIKRNERSSKLNMDPAVINPSGEEGVQQILALLGVEKLDTNVNLPNCGQISDLPAGAIVETYAQFRRDSISPVVAKPLPPGLAEAVRRVASVQQMTLKAVVESDKELAFHALINDPLVRIPTDKAWKMFNEMLEYTKEYLEGFPI